MPIQQIKNNLGVQLSKDTVHKRKEQYHCIILKKMTCIPKLSNYTTMKASMNLAKKKHAALATFNLLFIQ